MSKSRSGVAVPEISTGAKRTWIGARLDTGADTSSLHAGEVDVFEKGGTDLLHFFTHNHHGERIECEAEVFREEAVKSSTGRSLQQVFIQTPVKTMGGLEWMVRLSLADRSVMKCPMLLGRKALAGRFVVDPQAPQVFGKLG